MYCAVVASLVCLFLIVAVRCVPLLLRLRSVLFTWFWCYYLCCWVLVCLGLVVLVFGVCWVWCVGLPCLVWVMVLPSGFWICLRCFVRSGFYMIVTAC